jgi:hypothetical protein
MENGGGSRDSVRDHGRRHVARQEGELLAERITCTSNLLDCLFVVLACRFAGHYARMSAAGAGVQKEFWSLFENDLVTHGPGCCIRRSGDNCAFVEKRIVATLDHEAEQA